MSSYDHLRLTPDTFLLTPDHKWTSRVTFSPKEIHEMLGVPMSTIYDLCSSGQLKAFKIGIHWRIHRQGLFEYIQQQIDHSIIL